MKKDNRQRYLAILTFIALIVLLAVQVYWLFKVARLEEENFNQQVNKALIEARLEIGNTVSKCSDMKNYLCGHPCQYAVKQQKIEELDNIIKSKLNLYHIDLEYTFNITDSALRKNPSKIFGSKCYLQSLNGMLEKDGIQIRLQFPDRNKFLLAQLKGAFLLAFLAVIFVMVSFIITFTMFKKERMMGRQTSDFINNMVHEFQTPLSNIRLATSLIRKKEKSIHDEKILEYLTVIQNENSRLEKHVDEILKVTCNSNNHINTEEVDVHSIIASTVAEFSTRLESEKGKIELKLTASKHTIQAAPDHIKLIISNLIDNAIKYSEVAPHIVISSESTTNELIIKVKDNGIGIDKKEIGNIFEKYYRVSTGDVHNVKGFGLGLTYVKKLVEQYAGKIEVLSSKNAGTTFIICLPLSNETN
ncbi:MAG TPA: HAMP domain-containing sensor histidine kinase [Prolixibacteraceae bacterium]|nr:HAMP domain-containing sensor histidine kinase [Prolixibacteraceae bacterium]